MKKIFFLFLLLSFQKTLSCFRCKKEKNSYVYYHKDEIQIDGQMIPKPEAVFICTKKQDTTNLKTLLDSNRILVLTKNTKDQTPVQYAAILGKKKSLKILNEYLEDDEREDARQWIQKHVKHEGILECLDSDSEE